LQNLQSSTKSTADSLAAQLALQYEVFVNVQYDNNKALFLFNNSKNEIKFCGIKVGDLRAESNPGGPVPIAALMMKSIFLNEEYIARGTFAFVRHGNEVTGSGESTLQAEKWSGVVTFTRAPALPSKTREIVERFSRRVAGSAPSRGCKGREMRGKPQSRSEP
jgi:hypothetical protein